MIERQPLPAGKYGLFLMLAETGPWTWIFLKTLQDGEATSMIRKMMHCVWKYNQLNIHIRNGCLTILRTAKLIMPRWNCNGN